jgi:hypothetical protein
MGFKQEILTALHTGKDHNTLFDIARRHQAHGLTDEEAYRLLQEIWLDFGFDSSDQESALRNELEFVMERVWYFGADAN